MFKKFFSGLLAMSIAASFSVISASAATKGDVDGSGSIDIEDAVAVISHVNGVKVLSSSAMKLADVDSSGNVDIVDAVAIIGHVNGLSPIGGGGGGTVTSGRKLEALRKKYSTYSLMLYDKENEIKEYYDFGGSNYYFAMYYDGTLGFYEVKATDGYTYIVAPSDKFYYKDKFSTTPPDIDPIGFVGTTYIKTETKGGMTYEYYKPAEGIFKGNATVIYGFDSSGNLKTFEYTSDYEYDRVGKYDVVSLESVDKSKFAVPNLSGYTQKN